MTDFNIFYERYYSFVYKSALAYLFQKDLAEDVTQEVFCAAFERFEHLKTHENIKGWLTITIRNQSTKAAKKYIRKPPSSPDPPEEDIGLLELLPFDFPEAEADLLRDYYEHCYPVAYLAVKHKTTANGIYIRLTRARAKLKARLLKENSPEEVFTIERGGGQRE